MAYRGTGMVGPPCYRHEAAEGTANCTVCRRFICEICVLFESTRAMCPSCALMHRRKRKIKRAAAGAFGAAAIAVLVSALAFIVTWEPITWRSATRATVCRDCVRFREPARIGPAPSIDHSMAPMRPIHVILLREGDISRRVFFTPDGQTIRLMPATIP